MNNLGEIAANLIYIFMSFGVSLIFWAKDSNTGIKRIAVSAHSVILLGLFGTAFAIGYYGFADQSMLMPFYILLTIPIASIVTSLLFFKGPKWVRLLHAWNFVALPWTWFVGTMAVTGDWL